ncbi:hypothetical protein TRFO_35028 [Tritrichomonas foetus]|uniref:non-specific serine/threonine protein kinase n=1 Tax=Tritrichomonas foetus TaxID=1144522 RepID=A0A1J4JJ24_9EUKA|nr:hypothetical protein TRFO_35028 [Tritrichomonas foetus]|eukprot:OHS98593.1 hypothetical protein TRFO_35028 [Tritrichomonas foetus]
MRFWGIYQQNEKNEEESKHNHFQKNIEKTEQNFNNEKIMNLENEVDMFYGENDDDDDVEYYSDHGIEFDNLNDTSSSMFRTFAGTPGFVPPEVISGEGFSEKCDVFALGVILYQMIEVNLPFTVQRFSSTQLFNEAQNLVNYNQFPDNFSPLLCDLLKKMLQPDQERRSFLIELIDHPWLKNIQMQSSASANDLLSDSHCKGLNNLTLSSNFPKNVNNIFNFPKYFEFLEHLNEQKRNKLRREEINMIIVKECARYSDVDANELIHLLIEGEINTFTTLYYVLCGPFYERSQTGSGRLPPLCHGFIQNKMLKKQNQMFVFGSNPTLKKKPTITKVQSSVISQHSSALPKIPVKHHF